MNLLSRDSSKHNKMLEYLYFFLLCTIFALIFYLYIRIKKYFPILKMAEELIGNLGYGTPQQTQSVKNSSNAFSLEIAKLYLGKVYTEEKIKELNEEEVENFLIITKLSSRVRW